MSYCKRDLDAMNFEQFKAYILQKLEEFETHSHQDVDMQPFMNGTQTVPLGDWFEWFGCQAKLM